MKLSPTSDGFHTLQGRSDIITARFGQSRVGVNAKYFAWNRAKDEGLRPRPHVTR
jgi:hypothetical protein